MGGPRRCGDCRRANEGHRMSGAIILTACLVIGVDDGDSIKVSCPDVPAVMSIRLAELDAPEIEHKALHIAEQPWGRESKAALTALCLKQPATVRPKTTDRYGRTIATVECNGVNANEEQVKTGNAWAYMTPRRSQITALAKAAQ